MKRPSPSFVIPAGFSLALHAVLLIVLPRYATEVSHVDNTRSSDLMAIREADPVPEPTIPQPEEEPLPEFIIGDTAGKGFASHEIPDELEATAREADEDQAFPSLDPAGA